jgi:hypothetical protein
MALKRVRLELGRTKEFPNGSRSRGYEFTAPLDQEDRLDPAEWKKHRDQCRVRPSWRICLDPRAG